MALPVQKHLWETLGLAHPDAKFTGPAIMLRAPKVPDAVFEADFRKCSQTIPRLQVLDVSSIGQAQEAIVQVVRSAGGTNISYSCCAFQRIKCATRCIDTVGRKSVVIIEGHGSSDYHEESHKRTGHRSKKPTFVDLGKEHLSTDHIRVRHHSAVKIVLVAIAVLTLLAGCRMLLCCREVTAS